MKRKEEEERGGQIMKMILESELFLTAIHLDQSSVISPDLTRSISACLPLPLSGIDKGYIAVLTHGLTFGYWK